MLLPPPVNAGGKTLEKKWLCVAELDPRPNGDEASLPSGALAALLPSGHSCLSGGRKQIPPLSARRSQLVACSCLTVHVHSLPPPDTRSPPLPSGRARKWSLRFVPGHKDSINSLHSGWMKRKEGERSSAEAAVVLVEALCGVI